MSPAAFCVVLLALVGACAAEHGLDIEVMPTLTGAYAYRVSAHYTDTKHYSVEFTKRQKLGAETGAEKEAEMVHMDPQCAVKRCTLAVRIVNMAQPNIQIWPAEFTKQIWLNKKSAVSSSSSRTTHQQLKFGTHFKIGVMPMLLTNSKMVYRVDILCAGGDRTEFKGHTKGEKIVVVMNSEDAKCEQFDVKVWPAEINWREGNERPLLNPSATFVARGLRIPSGASHLIRFSAHFQLRISPPLEPNDGKTYFVEIKCRRSGQTQRMHTGEKAQFVAMVGEGEGQKKCQRDGGGEKQSHGKEWHGLQQQQQQKTDNNGNNCYDIAVWRVGTAWVDKAVLLSAPDVLKIIPSQAKSEERKEFGVQIGNGDTYLFKWLSNSNKRISNESNENKGTKKQQKVEQNLDKFNELREEMNEIKEKLLNSTTKMDQTSAQIGEIQSQLNEKKLGKMTEQIEEIQSEIAEMKQQNELKFEQIADQMDKQKNEESEKITAQIGQLSEEIIAVIKQSDERSFQQISTKIDKEIAAIKQQNEENLREIRIKMAEMKHQNEKKIEQISKQIVQFGTEIVKIKQQQQKEKKLAKLSDEGNGDRKDGEMEREISSLKNEVNGLRTTLLEIKKFLEDKTKRENKN